MNTAQLITTLGTVATSTYDKAEALYTLTKHNALTELKEELTQCYIEEDYAKAYDLVKDIKVTECKPHYTTKTHTKRGDSRLTYGYEMIAIGGHSGWLEAIEMAERLDRLYTIKNNPLFKERLSKLRQILKRKARLRATKNKIVSKNGRATKYHKRERVVLPSQRVGA